MITRQRAMAGLFDPLYPVLLYLFISITTLHEIVPFFLTIHIETLALCWAFFCGALYFALDDQSKLNTKNSAITLLIAGLLYVCAPLISSLFGEDELRILQDPEYVTLFKMVLFAPVMILLMKRPEYKKKITSSIIIFYSIFALYFLYRYLVLHEVRDFDLRPELKIRHGDANFLCTFFSMMVPIALLRAHQEWRQKNWTWAIALLSGALLIICTFLTESRMGIIATLASMLYLLLSPLLSLKNKIKVSACAMAILVLIMAINGERIMSRFHSIEDKSNTDRYLTMKNGVALFMGSPFIGVGAHKARHYFYQNTEYPHFQSESKSLEVHNTPLKIAAELGLIGLVLCAPLILGPWGWGLKVKSSERYFLIASLLSLTLSFMTIGIIYKDLFVLHLFFISGLAMNNGPGLKEQQE